MKKLCLSFLTILVGLFLFSCEKIAGAIAGPAGWVAVVAGVAGGAAGSSAGDALDQLWEE